jgi:hypothetical protein
MRTSTRDVRHHRILVEAYSKEILRRRYKIDNKFNPSTSSEDNQLVIKKRWDNEYNHIPVKPAARDPMATIERWHRTATINMPQESAFSILKKGINIKMNGDNKMELGHGIQGSKLLVARGGVGIGIAPLELVTCSHVFSPQLPLNLTCKLSSPNTVPFQSETEVIDDLYPRYRRRDNGEHVVIRRRNDTDFYAHNGWYVPHNLCISYRHNAHVNLQASETIRSPKYIFKLSRDEQAVANKLDC